MGRSDRSRVPARPMVDQWMAGLVEDVEWLWDFDAGKCSQYRWAFSGLGASSGHHERVSGGGVADPTARQAAETPADRLRRAGWLLCDAQQAVKAARSLLTLEDGRGVPEVSGNGYVGRREMRELKARQAARNARGDGYGDG